MFPLLVLDFTEQMAEQMADEYISQSKWLIVSSKRDTQNTFILHWCKRKRTIKPHGEKLNRGFCQYSK